MSDPVEFLSFIAVKRRQLQSQTFMKPVTPENTPKQLASSFEQPTLAYLEPYVGDGLTNVRGKFYQFETDPNALYRTRLKITSPSTKFTK